MASDYAILDEGANVSDHLPRKAIVSEEYCFCFLQCTSLTFPLREALKDVSFIGLLGPKNLGLPTPKCIYLFN